MEVSTFIEKLDEIRNSGKEYFEDMKSMTENMNEELTQYELFVANFFCEKENAESIRSMYRSLREPVYQERCINCLNMEKSTKIYQEYHEGMNKFLGDITRCYISESVDESQKETFETQLERAKSADHTFIESIFGGKNNERETTLLTEAMKNVEFLIDFLPEITKMKDQCNTIVENVNDNSDSLVKESVRLLYDSVGEYCYHCLYESVKTYEEIDKKIKEPFEKEKNESFVLL